MRWILSIGLVCALAILFPFTSNDHSAAAKTIAIYDCEGDACSSVTLTWDNDRQQFRVQNSSATRWVKVDAGNSTGGISMCIGPTKTEYLPLKTITGKYRATYNEESCVR